MAWSASDAMACVDGVGLSLSNRMSCVIRAGSKGYSVEEFKSRLILSAWNWIWMVCRWKVRKLSRYGARLEAVEPQVTTKSRHQRVSRWT